MSFRPTPSHEGEYATDPSTVPFSHHAAGGQDANTHKSAQDMLANKYYAVGPQVEEKNRWLCGLICSSLRAYSASIAQESEMTRVRDALSDETKGGATGVTAGATVGGSVTATPTSVIGSRASSRPSTPDEQSRRPLSSGSIGSFVSHQGRSPLRSPRTPRIGAAKEWLTRNAARIMHPHHDSSIPQSVVENFVDDLHFDRDSLLVCLQALESDSGHNDPAPPTTNTTTTGPSKFCLGNPYLSSAIRSRLSDAPSSHDLSSSASTAHEFVVSATPPLALYRSTVGLRMAMGIMRDDQGFWEGAVSRGEGASGIRMK